MTRAAASDPMHGFRFHARAVSGPIIPGADAADLLQPDGATAGFLIGDDRSEAGFSAITMPEITVEQAEYREGIRIYTMKFPGVPTIAEITLSRGVARNDTSFFNWVLAAIEGNEYSTNILIYQIQRPATSHVADTSRVGNIDVDAVVSKQYELWNCNPARIKPSGDMDASTSDVSIAELDVAIERFNIIRPA